ncbi:hypothetical protein [Spongiactinospora sp. TRM90649]|uniref:hypothetical protein n=1 Tax=Spongiactinospora sp. TRM90649 TaxID=3031114 RepID=UPI0023F8ECCA|nr:hypothetical protein [Spongiactinospora sp. TRM90649]MDF5752961.1 hypothetical protein [Spongiactinospora sp. TRM90649]
MAACLLEPYAPGRYRFLDLLRAFALRTLEATERPQARALALRRLPAYYLASAAPAHRLAYEGSMISAVGLLATGEGRAGTGHLHRARLPGGRDLAELFEQEGDGDE